jgi:hypothetical protein
MSSAAVAIIFLHLPVASESAGIDRIVPRNNPHKCLDLEHGHTGEHNRVVLWDCWNGTTQSWLLNEKSINPKHAPTKCLDFSANWHPEKKAEDGYTLQVANCDTLKEHHTWHYNAEDSSIRWKASSGEEKCMDLFENKMDNGALVGLWECNGLSHQKWAIGDGTGVEFVAMDPSGQVWWIVTTVLLSFALLVSLLGNCFQRWCWKKMNQDDEEAPLPTTGAGREVSGQIVGSPSQADRL